MTIPSDNGDHAPAADEHILLGANEFGDTIRIRRPPRVFTDERGRTVWMSKVEPVELEIELNGAPGTDPYDSASAVSG